LNIAVIVLLENTKCHSILMLFQKYQNLSRDSSTLTQINHKSFQISLDRPTFVLVSRLFQISETLML